MYRRTSHTTVKHNERALVYTYLHLFRKVDKYSAFHYCNKTHEMINLGKETLIMLF